MDHHNKAHQRSIAGWSDPFYDLSHIYYFWRVVLCLEPCHVLGLRVRQSKWKPSWWELSVYMLMVDGSIKWGFNKYCSIGSESYVLHKTICVMYFHSHVIYHLLCTVIFIIPCHACGVLGSLLYFADWFSWCYIDLTFHAKHGWRDSWWRRSGGCGES